MFARKLILISTLLSAAAACSPAKPAKNLPPPDGALNVVEHKADGLGDPEVTFHNVSDKAMALDFDGPTKVHLDVPANESRTVKLAAGTYQATTSGKDVLPSTNTLTLAADRRYEIAIKFVLELDVPEYAGKGFDCFETQTGLPFLTCARTPDRCQEMRKKMIQQNEKVTLSECAHHGELFHFRATSGGNVRVKFFTTQAACEAFAPKYHAKFPDEAVTPCSRMQ